MNSVEFERLMSYEVGNHQCLRGMVYAHFEFIYGSGARSANRVDEAAKRYIQELADRFIDTTASSQLNAADGLKKRILDSLNTAEDNKDHVLWKYSLDTICDFRSFIESL
jgi:hypothetical protein